MTTFRDTVTMLRRSLRRMRRYASLTVFIAAIPVVLLLLFVYVFGGTLGAGLGNGAGAGLGDDRAAYLAYVMPGILLITVSGAATGIAISVAMDMTQGIIARFRTMAISRGAVLVGHIGASVVQTLLAVGIVLVVALVIGFRPRTEPPAWLAAVGLLVLVTTAVCAFSVGLGLAANSVETASNSPMIFTLLPFFGSGFVPTGSMPEPLRWFAEHQPFTPVIETFRGLLAGSPIGGNGPVAIAWCVGITVVGYLWARRLYERPRRSVA